MGIKGLMKLITDHAPKAVKEMDMKALFGRKVAIDASMSLYQFMIAVRTGADESMLTNELGEVTSHLQGLFNRTIRMLEMGVKPVFVFDGKPPKLKGGELDNRREAKEQAKQEAEDAKDNDLEQEEINKYQRRTVRVTKEHNADAKRLLRLLGVPVIEAPGEAEAQCAALAKAGKVYATATEDMDALTFGTPKLLRHVTMAAARKEPILEVDLAQVLTGLKLNQDEFIDLCVLLGCDYTDAIKGIGPHTAYKLIQEHRTIEKALKHLGSERYKIPEDFLYKEAHELFKAPDVLTEDVKLEWKDPDEEGTIQFMVNEKNFNLERIKSGVKKIAKARGGGTQQRLENFFGNPTVVSSSSSSSSKRKADDKKDKKGAKKAKTDDGEKSKTTKGSSKESESAKSKAETPDKPKDAEKEKPSGSAGSSSKTPSKSKKEPKSKKEKKEKTEKKEKKEQKPSKPAEALKKQSEAPVSAAPSAKKPESAAAPTPMEVDESTQDNAAVKESVSHSAKSDSKPEEGAPTAADASTPANGDNNEGSAPAAAPMETDGDGAKAENAENGSSDSAGKDAKQEEEGNQSGEGSQENKEKKEPKKRKKPEGSDEKKSPKPKPKSKFGMADKPKTPKKPKKRKFGT